MLVEHGVRMLGAGLGAQAVLRGAANTYRHLKEKDLQGSRRKQLPSTDSLSELVKTKRLNLLFAARLPDAFRRAVALAKQDKSSNITYSAAGPVTQWAHTWQWALGNSSSCPNFVCLCSLVAGPQVRCNQVVCQGRCQGKAQPGNKPRLCYGTGLWCCSHSCCQVLWC